MWLEHNSVECPFDIANLLSLYQIPQISYIADILGDKTRFGYFFRTKPPASLQAKAIADIIILFKWTFVFMLYSDDAYGSGGIEAFIENLSCLAIQQYVQQQRYLLL